MAIFTGPASNGAGFVPVASATVPSSAPVAVSLVPWEHAARSNAAATVIPANALFLIILSPSFYK
jgi:hypothetical protein